MVMFVTAMTLLIVSLLAAQATLLLESIVQLVGNLTHPPTKNYLPTLVGGVLYRKDFLRRVNTLDSTTSS